MKFIVLALAIFATLYSKVVSSTEHPLNYNPQPIRVGLVIFPPLVLKETNDSCYGDAIDYVKKVLRSTRLPVQFYCGSAARIYNDFNQNKLDITINTKATKALNKTAHFSTKPYTKLEVMLYSKKTSVTKRCLQLIRLSITESAQGYSRKAISLLIRPTHAKPLWYFYVSIHTIL